MTKTDFIHRLNNLLTETLHEGPGPRVVSRQVADMLTTFIFNEAGAFAPDAIDEVCAIMQARVAAVEAEGFADADDDAEVLVAN